MANNTENFKEDFWKQAILNKKSTIKDAIFNLDNTAMRIVMVVNDDDELIGTISDGDIRRGLLNDIDLTEPVTNIVNEAPLVVPFGVDKKIIEKMMNANNIQQIPIVNESKHIVGIHLWDPILSHENISNTLVVMAGGEGRRMMPHTKNCPKPMLKIANKPILEHIVERARSEGITKFIFIVNYLGHVIEDYFSNGSKWGVNIDYIKEASPLGTAGGLSLINPFPEQSLIVTNGDVLTDVRYSELLKFHDDHQADATMAIRTHEWKNPFGVIKTDGVKIIGIEEKPSTTTNINAGVYVLSPNALKVLDKESYCDMTSLFDSLSEHNIIAYPIHEVWSDIGTPEDFINQNKT